MIDAFAAQVLRRPNDPDLGRRLVTNGRRLVDELYVQATIRRGE